MLEDLSTNQALLLWRDVPEHLCRRPNLLVIDDERQIEQDGRGCWLRFIWSELIRADIDNGYAIPITVQRARISLEVHQCAPDPVPASMQGEPGCRRWSQLAGSRICC